MHFRGYNVSFNKNHKLLHVLLCTRDSTSVFRLNKMMASVLNVTSSSAQHTLLEFFKNNKANLHFYNFTALLSMCFVPNIVVWNSYIKTQLCHSTGRYFSSKAKKTDSCFTVCPFNMDKDALHMVSHLALNGGFSNGFRCGLNNFDFSRDFPMWHQSPF